VEELIAGQLDVLRTLPDPAPSGQVHMLLVAAEAAAILGRGDWCMALYPAVAAHAEVVPMRPFDNALLHRIAGMAAGATGDYDRAAAHIETALAGAVSLPDAIDEPQVRHFYAQMLFARGKPDDRTRARELCAAALEGYQRFGIPVRAAMAEDLLHRIDP
jgi:ATP/maltotriose-dependent transcriptional regulator MalT